jgi:hypothetical protein
VKCEGLGSQLALNNTYAFTTFVLPRSVYRRIEAYLRSLFYCVRAENTVDTVSRAPTEILGRVPNAPYTVGTEVKKTLTLVPNPPGWLRAKTHYTNIVHWIEFSLNWFKGIFFEVSF